MLKVIIERKLSSKTEKPYNRVIFDNDGYQKRVFVDNTTVMAVLNVSPSQLEQMPLPYTEIVAQSK